jgi:hypothetical protein
VKVKILVAARYADFEIKRGLVKAKERTVGDEVEYPDEYARQIVKSGMAEEVKPEQAVEQSHSELRPEPVEGSARADTSSGAPKGDASYPVGDNEVAKADTERHSESVSAADAEGLERVGIIRPKQGRGR